MALFIAICSALTLLPIQCLIPSVHSNLVESCFLFHFEMQWVAVRESLVLVKELSWDVSEVIYLIFSFLICEMVMMITHHCQGIFFFFWRLTWDSVFNTQGDYIRGICKVERIIMINPNSFIINYIITNNWKENLPLCFITHSSTNSAGNQWKSSK